MPDLVHITYGQTSQNVSNTSNGMRQLAAWGVDKPYRLGFKLTFPHKASPT
ncbi:MAG: hypothetical protein LAT67_08930 [Balneolales bacterium]|nr:hypothetical protein [Balneolales bacterium]